MKKSLVAAALLGLSFLGQETFAACLSKADGMAPKGTTALKKDLSTGQWVYNTSYVMNRNFEFEKRSEFALPNGIKAVIVLLSAPGYSPDCEINVFVKSDVIFYDPTSANPSP